MKWTPVKRISCTDFNKNELLDSIIKSGIERMILKTSERKSEMNLNIAFPKLNIQSTEGIKFKGQYFYILKKGAEIPPRSLTRKAKKSFHPVIDFIHDFFFSACFQLIQQCFRTRSIQTDQSGNIITTVICCHIFIGNQCFCQ